MAASPSWTDVGVGRAADLRIDRGGRDLASDSARAARRGMHASSREHTARTEGDGRAAFAELAAGADTRTRARRRVHDRRPRGGPASSRLS
jgi:hypothetical protein